MNGDAPMVVGQMALMAVLIVVWFGLTWVAYRWQSEELERLFRQRIDAEELMPVTFPEANRVLTRPSGLEDCGDLAVFADGRECISAWRVPFRVRLWLLLLGGKIWLRVWSGHTQPPVALEISRFGPFVDPSEVDDVS